LTLDAPQSRLEALLPEAIAPVGARAVWTGEALLVAVPDGSDLLLRRFVNRPGQAGLVRDEPG
jgi:hypothetical protein